MGKQCLRWIAPVEMQSFLSGCRPEAEEESDYSLLI